MKTHRNGYRHRETIDETKDVLNSPNEKLKSKKKKEYQPGDRGIKPFDIIKACLLGGTGFLLWVYVLLLNSKFHHSIDVIIKLYFMITITITKTSSSLS